MYKPMILYIDELIKILTDFIGSEKEGFLLSDKRQKGVKVTGLTLFSKSSCVPCIRAFSNLGLAIYE